MSGRQLSRKFPALIALAALAIGAFLTIATGAVIQAEEETDDDAITAATVRIAAQRATDGTTKLALQTQTQADDSEWSEQVEPEDNDFPKADDATVDRWFDSGWLELDSGHTVRISARLLEDGALELALQELVHGDPGWRQLATDRWLPADQPRREWWHSSPLQLFAEGDETSYVPVVTGWHRFGTNVTHQSYTNEFGNVNSWVRTDSDEGGEWGTDAFGGVLHIGCWNGQGFGINLDGFAPQSAETLAVALSIDGILYTADWQVHTGYQDDEATHSNVEPPDSRALYERLRNAISLSAQIEGIEGTHTWNLVDTFRTPVQGNIDNCGAYVEGQAQIPPSPTYVPLATSNDVRQGNLRYGTGHWDDGRLYTEIETHDSTGATFLRVRCDGDDSIDLNLESVPRIDASQVTVAWSVDGGAVSLETWSVGNWEERYYWISPPSATATLKLLRGARSFTYWINSGDLSAVELDLSAADLLGQLAAAGGAGPFTLYLSKTFTTPLQANIDNCGNTIHGETREVEWDYVPLVDVNGGTDTGGSYGANLHDDGSIYTYSTVPSVGDGTGSSSTFDVHCHAVEGVGHMGVIIHNLPELDVEKIEVAIRIDSGPAITSTWWYNWWGESGGAGAHNRQLLLEQLRWASTLTVESAEHGIGPFTFNLAGFLDTPIQANIDNCGRYKPGETREPPQPEYDYVPIVGVSAHTASGLQYEASLQDSDGVYTAVSRIEQVDGTFNVFSVSCQASGGVAVHLSSLPANDSDEIELTIRYGAGDPTTERWQYHAIPTGGLATPNDTASVLEQLRSVAAITFEAPAHGWGPFTFDIAGMFDTPIQPNIDNCGMYKQGETRELPPAAQQMTVGQYQSQGARALPSTQLNAAYPWVDNGRTLGLFMWCGSSGVTVTLSGTWIDGLSGETASIEWSVDGGAVQSESWPITVNTDGSKRLSPSDARTIIAAWRNGSQLNLTIAGSEPIVEQFDLAAIFSQSLVSDFDECLVVPLPTLTLPVTDVARTEVGPVAYGAVRAGGSAWPYSYVWLEVPSDDAPEWAGYGSALGVSCGIDGIGAQIYGLGLDREVSIDGDTVSVSYSVDGGAVNVETWDVAPWGQWHIVSPQDDDTFYAAINGADSLTISVASDPEFVETYDFAGNGFWETPVQPNLDACAGS